MPDSGLVGLAQLHGELRASAHVRRVVGLLQQLHLFLAGAAACAVLAFNPTFVAYWVGDHLFGGVTLNAVLAVGIVLNSLVHGLVTAASVIGNRAEVGCVSLLNGVAQLAAALMLGRYLGLVGVPLGALIAGCLTSVPAGFFLIDRSIGLNVRDVFVQRICPWLVKATPVAAAAMLIGLSRHWLGFWLAGVATALVLVAYAWQMRPLYSDIVSLDPKWTRWLALMKLVPPVSPEASVIAVPATNQS
jgi:hypothetical protein